ncbi:MAG: hypothetical protein KatS3mg052_2291 [Candidatus Roseilinea sp.]|nr:MAG: hypothetical protein KatS3mg052_2291 [Candidatus Roseilinea sp.]
MVRKAPVCPAPPRAKLMDINLPLLIAALVIGFIIGLLLARGRTRETIRELESRVANSADIRRARQARLHERAVPSWSSRTRTLTPSTPTSASSRRSCALAEQGREASQATIVRLQDELRAATTDRSAFEDELRQCHARLDELRAQLARALAEADELRARVTAETAREIAAPRAQFATETTREDADGFQPTPPTTPEFETEATAEAQGELTAPADIAVAAAVTHRPPAQRRR